MLTGAIMVGIVTLIFVRLFGYGNQRFFFTFLCSYVLIMGIDYFFEPRGFASLSMLLIVIPFAIVSTFLFEPMESGDQSHGSAKWGKKKDAQNAGHLTNEGFCLGAFGQADKGQLFHHKGHVVTCAPTGAGKGVGAVIPNLLKYQGSSLVIDIKGENYAVTARTRREMGQAVHLVDPFGVVGGGSSFNWLDRINPQSPDVVSESAALVEMLVVTDPNADQYWDDSAKDLLRGLVVYVASLPDELRNIGEVRKLLTSGEAVLMETLETMAESGDLGFGVVSRSANTFLAKADKDRSGVLSSALRHTAFLDDPRIAETLKRSDFNLSDIKSELMTVYLVMPPDKIAINNRFIRGFIGSALSAITSSNQQPLGGNVAFFLDEFAQLGRMQAIEDGISLVRGYGAAFWIYVQDLSQLKAVYPKWQTFLANSAKQFFATADFDTAKYISDMLGQRTEHYETTSTSSKFMDHNSHTTSQNKHARNLLNPDEVMKILDKNLVFIRGENPYKLDKISYLDDKTYQGLADPNPYHV